MAQTPKNYFFIRNQSSQYVREKKSTTIATNFKKLWLFLDFSNFPLFGSFAQRHICSICTFFPSLLWCHFGNVLLWFYFYWSLEHLVYILLCTVWMLPVPFKLLYFLAILIFGLCSVVHHLNAFYQSLFNYYIFWLF